MQRRQVTAVGLWGTALAVGVSVGAQVLDAGTEDTVTVPAGTFTMGSAPGAGDDDEAPPHPVTVAAFTMDRTEVTVARWNACVAAGRCPASRDPLPCNGSAPDRGDRPMNCVNWSEAARYCTWAGGRLPTEAEWEYAARGTDGRTYPWGNEAPANQLCWNTQDGTCRVGRHPSGGSPFGLLDLAGNVSEWTADGYQPYARGGRPVRGVYRVSRGGAWSTDNPWDVRAARREWHPPTERQATLGFRCVRTPR